MNTLQRIVEKISVVVLILRRVNPILLLNLYKVKR